MREVSENLSIYFRNVYNYPVILDRWLSSFRSVFKAIRENDYISPDLEKTSSKYPIYPNDYQPINDLTVFDIRKVKEVVRGNTDHLLSFVDDDTRFLKPSLDLIPLTEDSLRMDSDIQTTFFMSRDQLYNLEEYFLRYHSIPKYDNLLYYLINENTDTRYLTGSTSPSSQYSLESDNWETIRIVEMFHYLSHTLPKISYYDNYVLQATIDAIEEVGGIDIIPNSLETKVISNLSSENGIIDNICELSIKNIYAMVRDSSLVRNEIKDAVEIAFLDETTGFIASFNNFFQELIIDDEYNPLSQISETASDLVTNMSALRLTHILLNDESYDFSLSPLFQDGESIDGLTFKDGYGADIEQSIIQNYVNMVDENTIKNYLYLSYLYKHWPFKFLNCLSIIIQNFIEIKIMPPNLNFISESDIKTHLANNMVPIEGIINTGINFSTLASGINKWFNISNITRWIAESKISKMAVSLYVIDIFDKFIESEQFEIFLKELLRSIANRLIEIKQIDSSFDWYRSIMIFKLYFRSMLRSYSVDNMFATLTCRINTFLTTEFQSIHTNEYGINETLFQDWKITGAFNKDLYGEILLKHFNDFRNSKVARTNLANFLHNLYVGSVTKSVYNTVLSYFKIRTKTPTVVKFNCIPSSGKAPLTVRFINNSFNTESWYWNFGDGLNSRMKSPIHTYYRKGNYTVTLTATGVDGKEYSVSKTINVEEAIIVDPTPIPNFIFTPITGQEPLTIEFTNLSENAVEYFWTFGDGETSGETNPIHTFVNSGEYRVSLTATNSLGISRTLASSQLIIVEQVIDDDGQIYDTSGDPVYDTNDDPVYISTYQPHLEGQIYDTSGKPVFDTNDDPVIVSTIQEPLEGQIYDTSNNLVTDSTGDPVVVSTITNDLKGQIYDTNDNVITDTNDNFVIVSSSFIDDSVIQVFDTNDEEITDTTGDLVVIDK